MQQRTTKLRCWPPKAHPLLLTRKHLHMGCKCINMCVCVCVCGALSLYCRFENGTRNNTPKKYPPAMARVSRNGARIRLLTRCAIDGSNLQKSSFTWFMYDHSWCRSHAKCTESRNPHTKNETTKSKSFCCANPYACARSHQFHYYYYIDILLFCIHPFCLQLKHTPWTAGTSGIHLFTIVYFDLCAHTDLLAIGHWSKSCAGCSKCCA